MLVTCDPGALRSLISTARSLPKNASAVLERRTQLDSISSRRKAFDAFD
jgi:hypothetical protein